MVYARFAAVALWLPPICFPPSYNNPRMTRFLLILALFAGIASAADVTGNWTAQITGPDGNNLTVAYAFKQEGAKLSGTVTGPGGDIPIQTGTVDGDKIAFTFTFTGGGGEMKVGNEGTVKGEEIILTIKLNGETFGAPVTLKRAK
jgi:hypothetical protein